MKKLIAAIAAMTVGSGAVVMPVSAVETGLQNIEITARPVSYGETSGYCGAEDDGENVAWNFDEMTGTLTLSGSGYMMDYYRSMYAPWNDFNISEVVIEDGVSDIGAFAFYDCYDLTAVYIPGSVTNIGNGAFENCYNLDFADIPDGVENIEDFSFWGCGSLSSVYLPDSVAYVGDSAFAYCDNISSVTIENPDCEIFDSAATFCNDYEDYSNYFFNGSVYGHDDSTARDYAEYYEYSFVSLDSGPDTEDPTEPETEPTTEEQTESVTESETELTTTGTTKETTETSTETTEIMTETTEIMTETTEIMTETTTEVTTEQIPGSYDYDFVTWSVGDGEVTQGDRISIDIRVGTDYPGYLPIAGASFFLPQYDGLELARISGSEAYDSSVSYNLDLGTCRFSTYDGYGVSAENDSIVLTVTYEADEYCPVGDYSIGLSDILITDEYGNDISDYLQVSDGVITVEPSAEETTEWYTEPPTEETTETPETDEWGMEILGYCGPDATWSFDEFTGTLRIGGTGNMYDYGSYDNDYGYYEVSPWHYSCSVENVIIGDGITGIGDYAFDGEYYLSSVTVPESVTYIGYGAFGGCESLTSVSIPGGVESIYGEAFINCSGLESVTMADSVTYIGSEAFYNCNRLDSVIFSENITDIPKSAFYGTPWLNRQLGYSHIAVANGILFMANPYYTGEIIIPGEVTTIGEYAFEDCGLTSVTIPESVTDIEEGAFSRCAGLSSVEIPQSTEFIGEYAFNECTGLTAADIPDGITAINSGTFYQCAGLLSVTIPDSVTYIGSSAFSGCESLSSVVIPYSVMSIDYEAFCNCKSLIAITIEYPYCEIYDSDDTFSNGSYNGTAFYGTIYGHENSTAKDYAESYGYNFKSLESDPITGTTVPADPGSEITTTATTGTKEPVISTTMPATTEKSVTSRTAGTFPETAGAEKDTKDLGDIDSSGSIDSSDASMVLQEYALLATGQSGNLNDVQEKAADVNGDGSLDSSDASAILRYYAYTATGGSREFWEYI